MADQSDPDIPEVLGSQARQHLSIDRVVAKRRRILFEAKAPQPNPDVHRRFLRPARMMVLRSHGVYGFDPLRKALGRVPPLTTASNHGRFFAQRQRLESTYCVL